MKYDVAQTYTNMRAMRDSNATKLGWTDAQTQYLNYKLMTDMLKEVNVILPGLTVHDAGCGTGDFLTFLQQEKLEPRSYIGTDFIKESIESARAQHPGHDFRHADLLTHAPAVDVTLVFGALAYHKPRVVEDILENLWARSAVAFGFNTWWTLHKGYIYHEHIDQLRKCISRFLRGKNVHQKLGEEYGQPTEAMFVVFR